MHTVKLFLLHSLSVCQQLFALLMSQFFHFGPPYLHFVFLFTFCPLSRKNSVLQQEEEKREENIRQPTQCESDPKAIHHPLLLSQRLQESKSHAAEVCPPTLSLNGITLEPVVCLDFHFFTILSFHSFFIEPLIVFTLQLTILLPYSWHSTVRKVPFSRQLPNQLVCRTANDRGMICHSREHFCSALECSSDLSSTVECHV